MGNLIDRIFRGGSVVDFLEFGFFDFPVFNVADCAVCIGAGLILLYFIMDFVKDARRKTDIDAINAESDTEIERENTQVGESNNDN